MSDDLDDLERKILRQSTLTQPDPEDLRPRRDSLESAENELEGQLSALERALDDDDFARKFDAFSFEDSRAVARMETDALRKKAIEEARVPFVPDSRPGPKHGAKGVLADKRAHDKFNLIQVRRRIQ